ncbi:MAG: hypothetical protein ACON4Z_00255 [Planctomycetota bacterium]
MTKHLLIAVGLTAAAPIASAQQSILFTGRFPFVSVEAAVQGGSIVQMSEYDLSYSTPFPGYAVGRTLLGANTMHAYLGDGDQNGDFLKFDGWKPSYFTNVGIDGVFVKHGVTAPTFEDVFWTPRLDGATTPLEVLTAGGAPTPLAEGDWVRLLPNGACEFFLTQAQLAVAAGPQPNNDVPSAGALAQAANGALFYAPGDGGHWVNGNQTGQVYAYDGAILKIDAAAITYDAAGNVASLAPDSARLLINEVGSGPGGGINVRQYVDNAFAYDRSGAPIQTAGIYGKTGGLALDPNGGTFVPSYPDAVGVYGPEPNLAFCSNAGSYGGSIFTTASGGDVLEVNALGGPGTGVLCGSKTAGVPADGSWLGVQLDLANFQPTLLGMTLIDTPAQPLIADVDGFGRVLDSAAQPNLTVDFHGAPGVPVFAMIDVGPQAPLLFPPSFDIAALPLGWAGSSWPDLFLTTAPLALGIGLTDALGYTSVSVPNPNTPALTGLTALAQGIGIRADLLELSAPVMLQLQ